MLRADHLGAEELDGVLEGEPVAVVDDVAQALVGGCALVGGGGRRGEPALVDPAAVGAQGVEVLARQLEPAAGHQERPRHPGRGQRKIPSPASSAARTRAARFCSLMSISPSQTNGHPRSDERERMHPQMPRARRRPPCYAASVGNCLVLRPPAFRRKPLPRTYCRRRDKKRAKPWVFQGLSRAAAVDPGLKAHPGNSPRRAGGSDRATSSAGSRRVRRSW